MKGLIKVQFSKQFAGIRSRGGVCVAAVCSSRSGKRDDSSTKIAVNDREHPGKQERDETA